MSWAMDELEERAQAQLDRIHEYNEALQGISVRTSSPDGLVTAEVDAAGALVGLWLAPGANDLGTRQLGEHIVNTAALAAQRAFAQVAVATENFTETFGELLATRSPAIPGQLLSGREHPHSDDRDGEDLR